MLQLLNVMGFQRLKGRLRGRLLLWCVQLFDIAVLECPIYSRYLLQPGGDSMGRFGKKNGQAFRSPR